MVGNPFLRVAGLPGADRPRAANVSIIADRPDAARQQDRGTQLTGQSQADAASQPASMTLRVLTPFALGYFLTYLLRAVNAVVAPDLVAEIG